MLRRGGGGTSKTVSAAEIGARKPEHRPKRSLERPVSTGASSSMPAMDDQHDRHPVRELHADTFDLSRSKGSRFVHVRWYDLGRVVPREVRRVCLQCNCDMGVRHGGLHPPTPPPHPAAPRPPNTPRPPPINHTRHRRKRAVVESVASSCSCRCDIVASSSTWSRGGPRPSRPSSLRLLVFLPPRLLAVSSSSSRSISFSSSSLMYRPRPRSCRRCRRHRGALWVCAVVRAPQHSR